MQLKHTFDPYLVLRNKRHSKNQIKLQLLPFLTITHIKQSFKPIYFRIWNTLRTIFFLLIYPCQAFVEQYIYNFYVKSVPVCMYV